MEQVSAPDAEFRLKLGIGRRTLSYRIARMVQYSRPQAL